MAKRPEVSKSVLSVEDLGELRKRLSTMSMTGLRDLYHAAHYRCRLQDGKAPIGRDIQELVQVWKELRRGKA